MTLHANVAPGVHRIEHSFTNFYLLEQDDRLTLVDAGVVVAGDAIVTLDPYTGRRGPRIVAGAATVDSERNLRTLDAIAETGASTVLVGHGEPWTQGADAAVAAARLAGPA
jgi:glyoxylase-like metal-dependent hydrolase (beta-lactamase superfamily II)